jgi:nucleoside-diphosphate kinase
VVKPHVLKSNILSKVIGAILEGGFEISSMELHNMNKLEVDEIFEVYKGVLND